MAELNGTLRAEFADRLKCCVMPLSSRILPYMIAVMVFGVAASAADAALTTVPAGHELVQCISVDGDTAFDILFQIEEDQYRAVWMVASDPTVSIENAEIARFEAGEGLLSNSDTLVLAHVDPRNPKTGRKGERIGGTVLGALTKITLDIDVDLFAVNSSRIAPETAAPETAAPETAAPEAAAGAAGVAAPSIEARAIVTRAIAPLTISPKFSAQATYFKRNGDQYDQDFDCSGRR